jgi:hypothetical protein
MSLTLITTRTLKDKPFILHFKYEETKAQRNEGTYPKSHSYLKSELGLIPSNVSLEVHVFSHYAIMPLKYQVKTF